MSWKNLPSWVKGGILFPISILLISIIAGLVIAAIYNTTDGLEKGFFFAFFLVFFIAIFLFPSFLAGVIDSSPGSFGMEGNFIIALLAALITWFLIGAFLGYLIARIKRRNKR